VTSLPEYLPKRILSPALHVRRHQLASLGHLPLAHRYNLALCGFFLRGIGNNNAAFGLVFFLFIRFTRMRSPNGLIFMKQQ